MDASSLPPSPAALANDTKSTRYFQWTTTAASGAGQVRLDNYTIQLDNDTFNANMTRSLGRWWPLLRKDRVRVDQLPTPGLVALSLKARVVVHLQLVDDNND